MIIGTAGHIDHGKTVLIKALTGVDTDRLAEEKKRGISIELGFAEFKLPSGRIAGVVDVPGHEAFIKNMLAGATGFDVVLLVVAADDGVMPQTREHLAIVDMLDVKRGVIAITKADLVDPDMLALVEDEVKEVVAGTSLSDAPVISVSAISGKGLPELLNILDGVAEQVDMREIKGLWRLPVDRVFTLKGVGTVVTGTLWSGSVKPEDQAVILPENTQVRVRSVQVHSKTVEKAMAGNRVAINIPNIDVEDIHRGDWLASPGFLKPTRMFNSDFLLLGEAGRPLRNWTRVRVHHGTAEAMARVVLLDRDALNPGERGPVEIRLEKPLVIKSEDRFIIRSYSPMLTIGGGRVLESHPKRRKRFDEQAVALLTAFEEQDYETAIRLMLETESCPVTAAELAERTEFDRDSLNTSLKDLVGQGSVIEIKGGESLLYLGSERYNDLATRVTNAVASHHQQFPLEPGISKESLKDRVLKVCHMKTFEIFLRDLVKDKLIVIEKNIVASPEHAGGGAAAEKAMIVESVFKKAGVSPPSLKEAEAELNMTAKDLQTVVGQLKKSGALYDVGGGMLFHITTLLQLQGDVREYLASHGQMTAAEFRDLIGTSRKYAIPLLEYLDRKGVTKREGDVRVLA